MPVQSAQGKSLAVIMPNFNDAGMIQQAVEGVLAQTRKPNELIIIDDGSTDQSLSIITELAAREPLIKVLTNKENRGVVYSFNRSIEEVESEYVCFVSMDDSTDPSWLEKSMRLLEQFPRAGICCSDLFHIHPDGKKLRCSGQWSQQPRFFTGREFANVVNGHHISGTTVVVKKQPLKEVGAYRPELKWHSDWFAWLAIAMRHGVCFIPECLVTLRVRDTSHSEVGRKNWMEQSAVLKNLFNLLNTEQFSDILPHFIWGNVMNHFGSEPIRAVLENPGLWNQVNAMLVGDLLSRLQFQAGSV